VRLTNPGGVGGRIQLATLAAPGRGQGRQPIVTLVPEADIQEYLEQVRSAEDALTRELRAMRPGEAPVLPPGPNADPAA